MSTTAQAKNELITVVVDKVRKEVTTETIDLTTKKGRDDIASRAYKVSKMKNAVNKQIIDPSVEEYKQSVKAVGGGKNYWNGEMDSLRDEIRKPLNEWEEKEAIKEKKRVDDITERIQGISVLAVEPQGETKDHIAEMIEAVDNIDCEIGFDEFTQEALQAKSLSKEILSGRLNEIIKKELEESSRLKMAVQQKELDDRQAKIDLKNKVQERLNTLMMIPTTMFGKKASEINTKIIKLEDYRVDIEEFGDLYEKASESVITVIAQLKVMLDNQCLVEQAQAKQAQKDTDNFNAQNLKVSNINATTQITDNDIVNNTHEVAKIIDSAGADGNDARIKPVTDGLEDLTNKEKMNDQLQFWAKEYGVHGGMYSDLMNIINQYI